MKEALIGEELTLAAPTADHLPRLVTATVDALFEAAGAELDDPDALRSQLDEAVSTLGTAAADPVTARLTVHEHGLHISLQARDDADRVATVDCRI